MKEGDFQVGFKLTPQRMAILDFLEGNEEHPSAEDIYLAVREQFPSISLATVYNTLDLLKRRGEVLELMFDPARKRYDPNTHEHHHLVCTGCGRVVDIHRRFPVGLTDEEAEGFSVMRNHVEFYGVCPSCMRKGGESDG
jgi:Fur family peroxide stress response transcriptional regulator